MPMVKKSITLTEKQEEWLQAQMATGSFASESEVVRDLIRREQERVEEVELIRKKLIEAEQSGFSFRTPNDIAASVLAKRVKHGEI